MDALDLSAASPGCGGKSEHSRLTTEGFVEGIWLIGGVPQIAISKGFVSKTTSLRFPKALGRRLKNMLFAFLFAFHPTRSLRARVVVAVPRHSRVARE